MASSFPSPSSARTKPSQPSSSASPATTSRKFPSECPACQARRRSLHQNSLFHGLCHQVARKALFHGRKIGPEQWKVLFVSGHAIATGLGAEVVAGLEGEFVNIRESTAKMSVKRASSLVEYVLAYCATNGIELEREHGER